MNVLQLVTFPFHWASKFYTDFREHRKYELHFDRASTEEEGPDRQAAFDALWALYQGQKDVKAALLVGILSGDKVNYPQFYNPGRARMAFQFGADKNDVSCAIHLASLAVMEAPDTANLDSEIALLKTAADHPSVFNWRAMAEAGVSLMQHQNDEYNFIGLDFLEQTVATQDMFAHYYLGNLLIAKVDEDKGDEADLERAFALLRVAATQIPRAAGDLASNLFLLKMDKVEPLVIAEWLIKHPLNCFKLEGVVLLINQLAIGLKPPTALLELACQTSVLGCIYLMDLLNKPLKDGTPKPELEALLFKAITQHAMNDDVNALALQAGCYQNGIGTTIDLRAAHQILETILPRIKADRRDASEYDLMCLAFCLYQQKPDAEDKDQLRNQALTFARRFYRQGEPEAQAILHLLTDDWAEGCPPLSALVETSTFAADHYAKAVTS